MPSGIPRSSSRSKRPKRRSAGSRTFGRLVAPMTMTWFCGLRPSISVSSCETMRRSTSPWVFSRFGAIASISSMKMIAGEFSSASSKTLRSPASDSPERFDITSGPLSVLKYTPVSDSTARASIVFPEPGGPVRRMPRGARIPSVSKRIGWTSGRSIISFSRSRCFCIPPMSS